MRVLVALLAFAPLIAWVAVSPVRGASTEIGPGDDWCAAANALRPGEELRLRPGDYQGPCTLRAGGTPDAPVVIRGTGATRARIVFLESHDNVINIAASFVTLRHLAFGPTRADVDAVRVRAGDHVTVQDCAFADVGGIAIVSNHRTARALTIRDNEIVSSRATAIYLGCHDGLSCRITDARIEGNYISGVEAPPPQIGYGVQIKLNSTAVISDNVIVGTKGPGIMVYGAGEPALKSMVERNFVAKSRTSSAIVIGGGPVTVQNNITFGGAEAGIGVEDYGRRGLLRRITIAHNTVYGGRNAGIEVPPTGDIDVKLFYNAAHSAGRALPPWRTGIIAVGNVDCASTPCFIDPLELDFGPSPGSPLVGRARQGPDLPVDDFFGTRRPRVSSAGAIDQPRGSLRLGPKAGRR